MRLIDADALKSEIIKKLGISDRKYLLPAENAIWSVINAQPTIEPDCKKGHKINQHRYPAKWVCSECGERHFDFSENFCSNCGADMRGEQDGKNT